MCIETLAYIFISITWTREFHLTIIRLQEVIFNKKHFQIITVYVI